ncbi:MAG TPA: T9SS type A sorting domain-containing protein [Bacteroidia bacterium]|nr:T9SS type A sorting domain-containing protein [Bacteroidota bacterium]MBP6656838.1 T9SS type A sorting domain-containing protein [Bacteroidia bacterium]MBK8584922.1 T9SS type A sorting domain-containing protein [Bacteroidota bacterium]MBP9789165.1 T9SS type A sorting domain-containing protein [Bacteroidia bacterium]MBP9923145.1 T9SS type A sorting domain-containing protein [Bacteroidia bacterium]
MKQLLLLLAVLLIFKQDVSAQNRNSIWCFGDSAGIDFRNLNNPVPISTGMDGRGGCSSISDSSGNLVFYSFSYVSYALTKILSANHTVMPNCTLLQGWGLYNDNLIVPKPESNHEYYNFYLGDAGAIDTTYYALMDMNLNGGLGDVVRKNVPIGAYRGADCLTAVKHGNGRDWWLIGKFSSNPTGNIDRYYVYLITPDSVCAPIVQTFGIGKDTDFQKIIWHPSYNKFININASGLMAEYDFDRCSGIITLNRIIFSQQFSNYTRLFNEGAYSANGNVFYLTYNSFGGNFGDYNYLLQFDLTASDIAASCDTLDSTRYVPTDAGAVRRGPDGKIYYAQAYIPSNALNYPYADSMYNYINQNLGVVNFPDSLGLACDFQPFSFYLGGKRTYWGLPNNPEYDLGPVVGSACDTLTNKVNEIIKIAFTVYPNPTSNEITVYSNELFNKSKLRIFNSIGELVRCVELPDQQMLTTVSLIELPPGIYSYQINSSNNLDKKDKFVIIK